jgi:hypothetical protein
MFLPFSRQAVSGESLLMQKAFRVADFRRDYVGERDKLV